MENGTGNITNRPIAPKRQEMMTTFQEILIAFAAVCVVLLVVLTVRIVRFLDHLDGTLSRVEKETLPAITRLSALLGRLDALTEDIENAWFTTRKTMDNLGLPPLFRLLRWIPGASGKIPFPFGFLLNAVSSGVRAFRSVWTARNRKTSSSGEESPSRKS